jgi:RecA-family ATPase
MTDNIRVLADRMWAEAGHTKVSPFDLAGADVAHWRGLPEPVVEFVVADLLHRRSAILIAGDGGAGKSILCQLLSTCVAAGRPFLGRAVMSGPAVFISGEDDQDILRNRQARVCKALGLDPAQLDGKLYIRSMTDADMVIWREGEATDLAEQLASDLASIRPILVIIDSAVFAFDDDEIRRRPVAAFLVHLNRLARRLEASVVLVTHTSKTGGPSGSTAWQNQARGGLLLEKGEAGPVLKPLKVSYGAAQQPIPLYWNDDGVLMPMQADTGLVSKLVEKNADDEVLAAITKAWHGPGDPLSSAQQASSRYLPKVLALKTGRKAREFEAAMNRLISAERVVNARKRKGRYGLCAIEDVPKKGDRNPHSVEPTGEA